MFSSLSIMTSLHFTRLYTLVQPTGLFAKMLPRGSHFTPELESTSIPTSRFPECPNLVLYESPRDAKIMILLN